jgi:predicted GNAT family acetyltransferase
MKVIRLPDAATFLERTVTLSSDEPYLTNVMGSVATSIANGIRHYDRQFWWVIEDDVGVTRAMMMRTAPFKLVLSPMPLEAVAPAARAVLGDDPEIPGVSGSEALVEGFLDTFTQGSSRHLVRTIERRLWIYKLGPLAAPAPTPGASRLATADDLELLTRWWWAFALETDIERHGLEEGLRGALAEGRIHLWHVDDLVVCALGTSPVVDGPGGSVVRIGPVYTPLEQRRRGYAGQLTATVSSRLVDQGHRVMLFTNSTNATSNGVYTRIGYVKIDEIVECSLTAPD